MLTLDSEVTPCNTGVTDKDPADIAGCKETIANARNSRKGQNIDTYPEDAVPTPSNSYCPN